MCFPGGGGQPGDDCALGPEVCEGLVCIQRRGGHICSLPCTSDDDCAAAAEGWKCREEETADETKVNVCVAPDL